MARGKSFAVKENAKVRTPAASPLRALAGPVKLSINVSSEVGTRLRRLAFDERLSESSIVEVALGLLFAKTSDASLGKFLRERGASLRRSSSAPAGARP